MTASPSVTPSSLERRLQLTVSIAEVEQEAQKRLQRISRSVKMPGFRPGKVPMKVVAQTYGAQAQSEAMNEVIGRVYGHAVVEQKLRVAGPPSIEPAKESSGSDQMLSFEAVVEVYPDITCPDLAGVEIKKSVVKLLRPTLIAPSRRCASSAPPLKTLAGLRKRVTA